MPGRRGRNGRGPPLARRLSVVGQSDHAYEERARRSAETAARDSYGRLLAYVAARTGDMADAEDALAEAFAAALETWPRTGAPNNPDAWLLTAARRKLIDAARRAKTRADAAAELERIADEPGQADATLPDERLRLLFICAHPAIDPSARTPLMLQAVLGLDAARIASAFLTRPATMSQRLVRAKAKIKASGARFETPDMEALPERLDAVLEAIYAAFSAGWDDAAGADERRRGLAEEAVWLARLAARLLPQEPEALGLKSLLLHAHARRNARRDGQGRYVPLGAQPPSLWDLDMAREAEAALRAALAARRLGRFQLEAAIQSAHAARALTGRTDWAAISRLYQALVRLRPTLGALVGHAAALGEAEGPAAGLSALRDLPDEAESYQPYWAAQAHLLAAVGRLAAARTAYARAVGLCEDSAVRTFLIGRAEQLCSSDGPSPDAHGQNAQRDSATGEAAG